MPGTHLPGLEQGRVLVAQEEPVVAVAVIARAEEAQIAALPAASDRVAEEAQIAGLPVPAEVAEV